MDDPGSSYGAYQIHSTNELVPPRRDTRQYGDIPPPDCEVEGRFPAYQELFDEHKIQHGRLHTPATPGDSPVDPSVIKVL